MTVTVHRLPTSDAIPTALKAIYIEAFPANEREPWPDLVAAHRDGTQVTYLAERDGKPVGLATLNPLDGLDMARLGYLAVDSTVRNQRIGSTLLQAIIAEAPALGWIDGLVLEVELADAPDWHDRHLQSRRLGFFRRHGAVDELDIAYAIPDLVTDEPTPMHLLTIPTTAAPAVPVTTVVRSLYGTVYPAHGDLLNAVLDAAVDPEEGVLPPVIAQMIEDNLRHPERRRPRTTRAERTALAAQTLTEQAADSFYTAATERAQERLRARSA
jgi:ribosomal protein S18 acetylase RimI-like enzyme